jgi:ribonuclease T2
MKMLRLLLLFVLLPATACNSNSHPAPANEAINSRADSSPDFDYYLLSLSWAPNFCATHSGPATECGTGRQTRFVLHGLWPQSEQGRLEQPCQHTPPIPEDVVRYALNFYPSAGLVQHEWQCHGVYSGLSARDYFTAAGKAFQSIQIPASAGALSEDTQLSSSSLVRQFEQANSAPSGAFVTSCHDGELVAVEACFTKDMKLRPCSHAQHSCSGSLLLRAPR